MQSHELGELAVLSGVWPLYEVENGVLRLVGKTRDLADGRLKRVPVRDYLNRQGRFAHFTDDDIEYFQSKIDQMWTKWLVPGVIPFRMQAEEARPPARPSGNGSSVGRARPATRRRGETPSD